MVHEINNKKQPKNRRFIISVGLSLLATALFVIGALIKKNGVSLDMYLGAVWVFILSLIVSFSLSHNFGKDRTQTK